MPKRIVTFLDNMDELREDSNVAVDDLLSRVNIKPLIANPKGFGKAFKSLVLQFLRDNRQLIAKASLEGKKLAKSL